MSTLKRKQKEKEQRRNLIIDAAQTLFFSRPYDEITIDAIAKKAQLAKGTVYLYFKSKDSLYAAVALRGARIQNRMFEEAVSKKKNGLEKVFATGEAYYEFYKRHPEYFRMAREAENMSIIDTGDVNVAEFLDASHKNFETLYNAVVEGIKDGSIESDIDPTLTSVFLIQSTKSIIELPPGFEMFLKEGTGTDKDATMRFTLQMLRRSLQQRNQPEKTGAREE